MVRKKSGEAGSGEEPDRGRSWFDAPRVSLAVSFLLLVIVLLLPVLTPDSDAGRFEVEAGRFEVEAGRLSFEVAPIWLEAPARVEIERALARLGRISLREGEFDEWLRQIPLCSPWIESIEFAEKVYPDGLDLRFELRRPVAVVAAASDRMLVDADGVVLGPQELSPRFVEDVRPLVVFLDGDRPALEPGDRLEDVVLRAGLEVCLEVNPHLHALRKRGLDLVLVDVTSMARADSARKTDVILYATDFKRVEWGRPRVQRPDEPSAEVKIRNLEYALDNVPPGREVVGYCVQYPLLSQVSYLHRSAEPALALVGGAADPFQRPAD